MFLLVPAYPGCPGSKAVKRSLLFLVLAHLGIPGKGPLNVYIDTMCVGSAASGVGGGGVEERGRRDESTAPVRAPREDPGAADDL